MISAKLVLGVFLFAAAMGANAQSVYPPNTSIAYLINNNLDKIYPYRGAYYDPLKPGTGLLLDLGSSGNAFVSYYDYTSTGAPMWYYLSGTYQPSDEATRWTTGVIGTLSGNFTLVTDGQCLGCNYTPTTEAPTDIPVTMVWTNSREVKLTIGNQTWDMTAPNFDGESDGDYLVGKWVMHSITVFSNWNITTYLGGVETVENYGGFTFDGMSVVSISKDPAGNGIKVANSSAPGLTAFRSGVSTYVPVCAEQDTKRCAANMTLNPLGGMKDTFAACADNLSGAHFELWYDSQSNRIGADLVGAAQTIGPANMHVDLYMESPDLFIGRGIVEGTKQFGVTSYTGDYCTDGAMNYEMILQRLPDSTTGYNQPYLGPQIDGN